MSLASIDSANWTFFRPLGHFLSHFSDHLSGKAGAEILDTGDLWKVWGVLGLLTLGIIIRVLTKILQNLYFFDQKSHPLHPYIIPVTSELKRRSPIQMILKGKWRENITLSLMDTSGNRYPMQISLSPFRGYFMTPGETPVPIRVNDQPIPAHQRTYLKPQMELKFGDRIFTVLIQPTPAEKIQQLH